MTDITALIDVSDLVDGTTVEAADVLIPVNDLIDAINAELTGNPTATYERDWIKITAPTELTIAAGVITVTKMLHTVDTQADAASDDLDTINGLEDGHICILKCADAGRTVVLKHATGNLALPGNEDVYLDEHERSVMLIGISSSVYVLGAAIEAAGVGYTAADTADWGGSDPAEVDDALDALAARLVGRGYIAGMEINCTA